MDIRKTDPEYAEILERFMRDEAVNGDEVRLPARLHYLAVLAALMGCGGTEAYRELLPEARRSAQRISERMGYDGNMLNSKGE